MYLRLRQSSVRMANKTQWILELVDKLTAPMKEVIGAANKAADAVEDVGREAEESKSALEEMSAIDLFAIADSVENLANQFKQINTPGARFEQSMLEIEAITGVTGEALDELGKKARNTAKIFGGDASDMVESYKAVLSRLGPDIAYNQDALETMGVNIATLSKTMGNDAVGAMDALTTAMLQFRVDLSDPAKAAEEMTNMMNVMAAGAKEGAAEVPQISEALKQAGIQAKDSNLTFEETNAALQELARGGKTGSEAGVALRNVLAKMAGEDIIPKEAAEKLQSLGVDFDVVSDKTIPLTDRLRELQKAQADATVIAQIFGIENAAAANILINSVDAQDRLKEAITGTNTATEQADVVMSGYTETMSRVSAWFTDLKIGLFDITSSIAPFIDGLSGAVMVMANMANARKGILLLFNTLKTMPVIGKIVTLGSSLVSGAFGLMTTAAKALGVAIMNIPILGWIAAIVSALIALGAYFYKTSSTFRGFLWGMWEAVKAVFTGMGNFIKDVASGIWDLLKGVFNPANWFDDNYSFSDGLDRIANAASEYGKTIGEAFTKGREEGVEDFYQDNPDKRPEAQNAVGTNSNPEKAGASSMAIKNVSPQLSPTDLSPKPTGGSAVENTSGGSGSSSIKNITQRIDMKNYFTISSGGSRSEIDSVAEKVVKALNDRLRDGMIAVS